MKDPGNRNKMPVNIASKKYCKKRKRVRRMTTTLLKNSETEINETQFDEIKEELSSSSTTPMDIINGLELILTKCQIDALTHVSKIAHTESTKALEKTGILMMKCQRLGITETQITQVLGFIRDEMQLMVHIDINTLEKLITDTHYRNLFETGKSGGEDDINVRSGWENLLFNDAYNDAKPVDRCKYGCFNTNKSNHPNEHALGGYGDNYLILKPHMRRRVTCCNNDSCELCDMRLVGTLDNYAHVLAQYSDPELVSLVNTVCSENPVKTDLNYKEIQIHGPLALSDFQTLVVNRCYEYKEKIGLCGLFEKFKSLGINVIESDP